MPNTVSNDVPTFDLVNLKPIFQTYSKTLKTENCRCNGSIKKISLRVFISATLIALGLGFFGYFPDYS